MGFQDRNYYRPGGFGGFSFFPPVIKALLIANAAMFIIMFLSQSFSIGGVVAYQYLLHYFGLIPLDYPYASFYPWQLITYQFMHGGIWHFFFNMFLLWMFGMEIENMWGPKKFLAFYLLCGIAAGLFQLFLSPVFEGGVGPTIGASGAVFGVLVAFGMFFPDRYIYIYFLIPVKAKYLIAFLVIFEFLSIGGQSIVAHMAHIGGAVAGALFVFLDKRHNLDLGKIFDIFKSKGGRSGSSFKQPRQDMKFRRPFQSKDREVEDAQFYDITGKKENKEEISQEEIDRILDKISQSGYQNLTEREKKILFEASKKN